MEVVGTSHDRTHDLSNTGADVILARRRRRNAPLRRPAAWGGKPVPLMGINFGRLGFLASFPPNEFESAIEALIAGTLPISSRLMLEASVISGPLTTCNPHR